MKLHLLQELVDLENIKLFDKEQLRYTRAEVESARVDANREFLDKFEEIVEEDNDWAYKFRREHDRKTKDPFDFYLEIKEREEVRGKKGLPPRVVLLPDWDQDDEQRYDEEHAEKQAAARRKKAARKRNPNSVKISRTYQTGVSRAPGKKK